MALDIHRRVAPSLSSLCHSIRDSTTEGKKVDTLLLASLQDASLCNDGRETNNPQSEDDPSMVVAAAARVGPGS